MSEDEHLVTLIASGVCDRNGPTTIFQNLLESARQRKSNNASAG
jgi:hypothetical protein